MYVQIQHTMNHIAKPMMSQSSTRQLAFQRSRGYLAHHKAEQFAATGQAKAGTPLQLKGALFGGPGRLQGGASIMFLIS